MPPTATPKATQISPQATPELSPRTTPAFSEADQAIIYATVIRQLYTADHMHAEPPKFVAIHVLRTTDDSVGDPQAPHCDAVPIPESVQAAVVEALANMGPEVRWVDENATITLGNVHLQEDGSALISAQFRDAAGGTTGKTYVLEQLNGAWQIVGDTGVQWVT